METQVMPIAPELQTLIETRLDLVDRVLLEARLSRAERAAIVQELEAQILEQLERRTAQPTREDVLAVLSELDPPEAFLPEAFLSEQDEPSLAAVRPGRPRHRPDEIESRRTAKTAMPSGLSLWAGLLVAGTSLTTALLMTTAVWVAPEVVIGLVAVLQLAALTGAALGIASIFRSHVARTGLERVVAGAAAGTGVLTLLFLLALASIFTLEGAGEIAIFVLAGFVGGAWIHGAWLAAATGALWMRRTR